MLKVVKFTYVPKSNDFTNVDGNTLKWKDYLFDQRFILSILDHDGKLFKQDFYDLISEYVICLNEFPEDKINSIFNPIVGKKFKTSKDLDNEIIARTFDTFKSEENLLDVQ